MGSGEEKDTSDVVGAIAKHVVEKPKIDTVHSRESEVHRREREDSNTDRAIRSSPKQMSILGMLMRENKFNVVSAKKGQWNVLGNDEVAQAIVVEYQV